MECEDRAVKRVRVSKPQAPSAPCCEFAIVPSTLSSLINSYGALPSAESPMSPAQSGFGALAALSTRTPQTGFGALPSLNAFATALRWIAVRQRFAQFHKNLALTPLQQADGHTKRANVVTCLNRSYYGTSSDTDNSFFIGSWAKDTAIRPPRDVDVYFLLPVAVYHRFQTYAWARQSALLQEVKDKLVITYPHVEGMAGLVFGAN